MNLVVSNQHDIQQRVDWDITSLMKKAVSRYKEDYFTASLMIGLSKANKDKRDKQVIRNLQRYSLVKGKIFYQAPSDDRPRLVLPNITELLDALLYEYHDAKCYGHPGVEQTLRHVENDYYWRKMEKTIKMYVQSCEVCQRIKGRNTKPPGLLRSHAIPATRWTHLAMDFIVARPETNEGYDAILVVIDRLTK
ncbi:unnamed protein product [Phytophthora lilii]|uniref:Unnamed protein product n=1 Tax=Phytophthora lilii TaxID=2077276 RepID=A0A9W6WVY5_9STRA|nr:unnamed protein product [Phytophthora lilii]